MSDLVRIAELERQKHELLALVADSEADGDVVGALNFSARLNEIEERLTEESRKDHRVGEVSLLFEGAPVNGARTIDAAFAAQALAYFQGVVTRLFASSLQGLLAQRGKIRGAELAALDIRGIATGSFGFVLEEKNAQQFSAIKTPVRQSLEEAAALFEEFTQESDDDFLVDVDDINPRVFIALSKFFRHLEKNEASLKARLPSRVYAFDRAGVSRAYSRITNTHVKIDPVVWTGTLVGLSPVRRTFDFKKDGTDSIVSGKFSHQVSQDYLEKIESEEGIKLGGRFRARIDVGTLRKPDGSISVSHTVTDMEEYPKSANEFNS